MRILVVGAGATGGYFGGRLAQAGRDVTFLLRGRRAAQVRSEGLRLTSPHGDAVLHPTVLTVEELRAAPSFFDLVLISVKSYSLEDAMQDIAPAVGPATLVMPILNGMRHLETMADRFGKDRLLAGSVRIVADLTEDGIVEQRTPLGDLTVGFLPDAPQASRGRLQELGTQLSVPGFRLVIAGDVIDAMWQKWWLLASWNTVCILADGTIGQAVQAPHGERFTHAVLDECIAVAAANGHPAEPAKEAEMRAHFSNVASPVTSSMFRDLHRNLPVEADHILGDLIARAEQVPVPLLTAAYVRLKVYEAGRAVAA